MGLCVFSLPISLVMIEMIYTLSYYHHQIGSMNYYPLFRARSWNNGMRCMSIFLLYYFWDSQHHCCNMSIFSSINTLRPRQNGRHFADDIFKRIVLNETCRISIKISLKFVPKGPINNIPALVQIMAWRRPGDKPLSEPMVVSLPTHMCITRPQWIKIIT